ncbi:hypothetical protein OEZ86_013184 [Tetradesmus obliquus]|nr:hypothetical protein OEZ86_013184 [Tetradesmus obliquus]
MSGSDRSGSPQFMASQEYQYGEARRKKTFNDNIHGHITLHRAAVAIIDTPEFQRLRNLKQLGLTYYIFPGASHNRFEHSIGVGHLATEWGRHLIGSRGGPGPDGWALRNFEPEDRRHLTILQLAGLCHDLGHGPFSHVFEKELLPKLFPGNPQVVKEWHHETMSNKIFDYITSGDSGNDIDLGVLAGLDGSGMQLVKALMHGSANPAADYPSAPWLFDIVANKRNGIDVDKFDYLLRDSKMCGVAVQLDQARLMKLSRLDRAKEQVIFKMTEYGNIATGLFGSRAEMHRRVYTHQKVKAVEFMVCEALALAQAPLGLREAVENTADISLYLNLDDSLLPRLQALRLHPHDEHYEAVQQAQELMRQMARRQLYKFVQEVTLTPAARRMYAGMPTAEEVIGYQSSAKFDGVQLRAQDVILCETHIDQGMKEANPMDTVLFYQTRDRDMGDRAFAMQPSDVSNMLGSVYQDKKVRVYSKNRDKTYCAALKYAFEQWANAKLKTQPPGTPWRQSRAQQQQQQQQFALPDAAAFGSSGRVSWGANCFGGSGPGLPPRGSAAAEIGSAADASGGADGNAAMEHDGVAMVLQLGSQGEQLLQVPSRKRSLTQDMQSASQQQQQQQQQHGSQAGSGGGRSSCGFGSQLECDAAAADAAAAVDGRPAKQSKASSGGGRSSSSRGGAGLPGIEEDAAEGS